MAHWLRCCATNRKVAGSIPAGVIGFFVYIKSFRSHYGPGVDSACNRNKYQEHFLGGKGGQYVRLTTSHHPVPLPRNLGSLTSWNSLGLYRPVMGFFYLYRSRPTAYSKVTIQHNHLNRKNTIQNKKYTCKYKIYLFNFYTLYM